MKLSIKRYIPAVYAAAATLIIVAAILIFLPRLISLASVQRGIEGRLSQLAGGKIAYRSARLRLMPWPRMTVRNGTIDIPGKISGSIDTLIVVPKLIPLLTGDIELSKLKAVAPDLHIHLPAGNPPPVTGLSDALAAMVSSLGETAKSDISVRLKNGRITIVEKNYPLYVLQNIRGKLRLSPERVVLGINGATADGETLAVAAQFDPIRLTGRGELDLGRFFPRKMIRLMFPDAHWHLGDSRMDLHLSFVTENLKTFSGSMVSKLPVLTLTRGKENFSLRGGALTSTFAIGEKRRELVVQNLHLDDPELNLTGRFLTDPEAGDHRWEVNARDVDLKDAGRLAAVIAPGSKPLGNVFTIIKGGQGRTLQLKNVAATPAGLKSARGLTIEGMLESGEIFIPKPDLNLTEASGWITVANGLLEGKNLRARLGNSTGQGRFSMGLGKNKTPFFLDTFIHADLSQLPPLLRRLVKNKHFKQEMARISQARGTGEGRLILEQQEKRLLVTVDVARFDLFGNYARIPYPIIIRDGRFHYEAAGVTLNKLSGCIGDSVFSGLDASIAIPSPCQISINTGPIDANMDQIYPWLMRYDTVARFLKYFKSVAGHLCVDTLSLAGPAIRPADWDFALNGRVDHLQLNPTWLPFPLVLQRGRFTADPDTIAFDHMQVNTGETRLNTQGTLSGYLEHTRVLETSIMGALDAPVAAWIREITDLPPKIAWRSPLLLTPVHLTWDQQQAVVMLAGSVRLPNGPRVELDLKRTPRRLSIKQLAIRDDDSDARLSVHAEDGIIDFSFTGQLHERSLNAFFTDTPFLSGRVEGDFNARMRREFPQQSTASGHLYAEKLDFSVFDWPLAIAQASVAGVEDGLQIASTHLAWQGQEFLLDGAVTRFRDGLDLALTLAVGTVDWHQLTGMMETENEAHANPFKSLLQRIPLYGHVRVRTENLVCTETLTFCPLEAWVTFNDDQLDISISEASLCGISVTGTILLSDQYQIDVKPAATDQDLAATLACLWGDQKFIDGRFQLDGHLTADGQKDTPLLDPLTGDIGLTAAKGRIYHFGLAAKIFTLLNVTGLLRGELPDLEKKGFPYKTARAKARLENGTLIISDGEIDSSAMRIFFQGKENLSKKTHDLTIVVAPLKTIDLLVSHIPLVRDILDRGLVVYPIKVTGTWAEPQLNLLAPDAVGEEILGIFTRTLKLPLKILEPLFSGGKKEQSESETPP